MTATARLNWAPGDSCHRRCSGCHGWILPGQAWLSVVVDVGEVEICGTLCERCGKRLEEQEPAEGGAEVS